MLQVKGNSLHLTLLHFSQSCFAIVDEFGTHHEHLSFFVVLCPIESVTHDGDQQVQQHNRLGNQINNKDQSYQRGQAAALTKDLC